jgi:hypothetical protein
VNPEWDREFRESTESWARNREVVDAIDAQTRAIQEIADRPRRKAEGEYWDRVNARLEREAEAEAARRSRLTPEQRAEEDRQRNARLELARKEQAREEAARRRERRHKNVAEARRGLIAPIVWSVIMVIATIWVYQTGMAEWDRSQKVNPLLLLAGLFVPIGAIVAIIMTLIRAVALFLAAIGR